MGSTRPYGGRSGEQRRAERRDKLLEAARTVLMSEGLGKITVTAVCAGARLTERYFYESFSNRDALLDALFDRIASEEAVRVFTIVATGPADPRARMRLAFETTLDGLTKQPHLGQLLTQVQTDEALMRHRSAFTRKIATLSAQYAPVVFGAQSYQTAQVGVAVLFVIGGAIEAVLGWLNGTLDIPRDQLIDTCTDLLLAAATAMLPSTTTNHPQTPAEPDTEPATRSPTPTNLPTS